MHHYPCTRNVYNKTSGAFLSYMAAQISRVATLGGTTLQQNKNPLSFDCVGMWMFLCQISFDNNFEELSLMPSNLLIY